MSLRVCAMLHFGLGAWSRCWLPSSAGTTSRAAGSYPPSFFRARAGSEALGKAQIARGGSRRPAPAATGANLPTKQDRQVLCRAARCTAPDPGTPGRGRGGGPRRLGAATRVGGPCDAARLLELKSCFIAPAMPLLDLCFFVLHLAPVSRVAQYSRGLPSQNNPSETTRHVTVNTEPNASHTQLRADG